MSIKSGLPIAVSDEVDISTSSPDRDAEYRSAVGKTLKAYLVAIKELLNGKYRNLREIAPIHMTSACRPFAFIFPEGVVVRYDRYDNPDLTVLSGVPAHAFEQDGTPFDFTLVTAAQFVSKNFLFCVNDPTDFDPGPNTPAISLSVGSPDNGERRDIAKQRIFAISTNPSCLIVIGRTSSLNESNRRKLTALQNAMPKIKIMTYDDLTANARAMVENILGPLWDAGPHAEVYLLPERN